MKIKSIIKNNKSLLLTALGSIGFVTTIIFTVKATKKSQDIEDENTLEVAKLYIPVVLTGCASLACFWGANIFNKKTQASLTSAYALVNNSYKEYKTKLKELYGEEANENIKNEIMKDHRNDICIINDGIVSSNSTYLETIEPEIERTFYDSFSERYFDATLYDVLQAEYHLNRNYCLGSSVMLNEFYEFLGLEPVDGGDAIGWFMNDSEIFWVDFDHCIRFINGEEIIVINFVFYPEPIPEDFM